MNTTPLSKKTKAELISAYQELLAQQKTLETQAQHTYTEESTERIQETAKTVERGTRETVQEAVRALESTFDKATSDVATHLQKEIDRFTMVQRAISLAEERLAFLGDLESGAGIAKELISRLETERAALEREIAEQRRVWEREKEEEEYRAKTARTRKEEELTEAHRKREQQLKEQEELVSKKEKDMEQSLQKLERFEGDVARETGRRVEEERKTWERAHEQRIADIAQEKLLNEKLHEIEVKELRADVSRLEQEVAMLRKDAEQANKRAQDLALKIVEQRNTPRDMASAPQQHGQKEV
jgi:hypothetical protein